jgi:transcriptional regulator with XRE-family HTH domain
MSDLGNKQIMAKNIQHYMDIHGKTRQDMCNALGVKYTTFTDWVKGNAYPRIDKIELMANYFGISKADLVEEHTSSPSTPKIMTYYEQLNDIGKNEATKRVQELTYFPQYSAAPILNAAHADDYMNAPEDLKKLEESMMDDEDF